MRLALQLTSGPMSEDARTVRKIIEAALGQGHEVDLFLMDDGVYHLRSLEDLARAGLRLTVCAHNAYERGVGKVDYALFGGQNDWAEIVHDSQRVLSFG